MRRRLSGRGLNLLQKFNADFKVSAGFPLFAHQLELPPKFLIPLYDWAQLEVSTPDEIIRRHII